MNLLKSNVLLRLVLNLFALSTCYLGLFVTPALLYRIVNNTDWMGYWSMVAVLPLSAFGLVDILVNDLLPEHFQNMPGLHFRHLCLGGLAVLFSIQIYTCTAHGFPLASMMYYMLFVVFLPLSAIADMVLRFQVGEAAPQRRSQ